MFTLTGGSWDRVKLVRLSPVLTLLSCNGLICVLAFSLRSGSGPLKEFDIAVPDVQEKEKKKKKTPKHNLVFL